MRDLFLTDRFFVVFGSVAAFLALGFGAPSFFGPAQMLFFVACGLVVFDFLSLFVRKPALEIARKMQPTFGLGDPCAVEIEVKNGSFPTLDLAIVDELPFEFQIRDFEKKMPRLARGERRSVHFELFPKERGLLRFGQTRVFARTFLGLVERRVSAKNEAEVAVFPSILQMKRLELKAFQRATTSEGIKKMRRIGHSYEFEQIKNYAEGDDFRSLNWKASGRRGQLMVNQYEDEKSQQAYLIIDKSRVMRMPFGGLALLDWAVNSTLALANVILKKGDKAGLLTFSDVLGATIKAERSPRQIRFFLERLFDERQRKGEADFDLLFQAVRRLIPQRSLLVLFTNFESRYALDRALPVLLRLGRLHLLVVVFFENTEVADFSKREARTTEDIYHQTIAQQTVAEKREWARSLRQFGIQAVLTRPEDLSLATINKYLELKARGLV